MVPGHAQQVGGGAELGRAEPFNQRGEVHGYPHVLHGGSSKDGHEGGWPPTGNGPTPQKGISSLCEDFMFNFASSRFAHNVSRFRESKVRCFRFGLGKVTKFLVVELQPRTA